MKIQTKTDGKTSRLSYNDTMNGNMSLHVHNDGTTFINFHRCEGLKVQKFKEGEMGKYPQGITVEGYCEGKWILVTFFEKRKEVESGDSYSKGNVKGGIVQ